MSDTAKFDEKFDEDFFKVADQKKQELGHQLADGSGTLAEKEREHIRKLVGEFAAPLEAKAFEAGLRAGLAEVDENTRSRVMKKFATARGIVLSPVTDLPKSKSPATPADLARRANQLRSAALAEGKELSNIESVRRAYEEAGVPLT